MPDFWFDTVSLVIPNRQRYFDILPQFWDFLEEKAKQGIFKSSIKVYKELVGNEKPDQLEIWVKKVKDDFFLEPVDSVQMAQGRIAEIVINEPQWKPAHVAAFLDGADTWVIAQALALGGRVVTSEGCHPLSAKPFIPDVAKRVDVVCITLWDMLKELNVKL